MAATGKNALPVYPVLTAQAMATSFTSIVTDVRWLDNLTYRLSWTGTPTGTWTVQTSDDYLPPPAGSGTPQNAGTWDDLPLTAAITAAGSADRAVIDLNELPFAYVRLSYTAASGSGTAKATISGKGI